MGSRLLTGFIIVALILGAGYFIVSKRAEQKNIPESKAHQSMTITSSAFQQNDSIPRAYTCDGGPPSHEATDGQSNMNPPLEISGVPAGAKSLALIVDDPDAPGGTWVHWLIWNINPKTKEIAGHSVPQGATEGTTSFGKPGYGGPRPPRGTHHYFFKLYALDTALNLPPGTDKTALESAIKGHILEHAELVGLYCRG